MPQGGSAGEGEGGNGKVQFFDAELKCSFFFFASHSKKSGAIFTFLSNVIIPRIKDDITF